MRLTFWNSGNRWRSRDAPCKFASDCVGPFNKTEVFNASKLKHFLNKRLQPRPVIYKRPKRARRPLKDDQSVVTRAGRGSSPEARRHSQEGRPSCSHLASPEPSHQRRCSRGRQIQSWTLEPGHYNGTKTDQLCEGPIIWRQSSKYGRILRRSGSALSLTDLGIHCLPEQCC